MMQVKTTLCALSTFLALTIALAVWPVESWGADRARARQTRTKMQIERMIDSVGKTPPEWYDSVKLDYPQTLDLSWPQPPPEGWNNRKNVGQYIWDVINPNPNKWKSGVRFMHFMLEKHSRDVELRTRVMQSMGRMYFVFFRDYPRAAFWWRAAGVDKAELVHRACIWPNAIGGWATGRWPRICSKSCRYYYPAIKLWADMGETDQKALRVAGAFAQRWLYVDMAYLSAGDACRTVGLLDDAVSYYENVLTRFARSGKNGQTNSSAITSVPERISKGIKIYDSLEAESRARRESTAAKHRPMRASLYIEVTVSPSGRIESVKVTQHKEKQFFSAIEDTTAHGL